MYCFNTLRKAEKCYNLYLYVWQFTKGKWICIPEPEANSFVLVLLPFPPSLRTKSAIPEPSNQVLICQILDWKLLLFRSMLLGSPEVIFLALKCIHENSLISSALFWAPFPSHFTTTLPLLLDFSRYAIFQYSLELKTNLIQSIESKKRRKVIL